MTKLYSPKEMKNAIFLFEISESLIDYLLKYTIYNTLSISDHKKIFYK
jgi:hypothetical protein